MRDDDRPDREHRDANRLSSRFDAGYSEYIAYTEILILVPNDFLFLDEANGALDAFGNEPHGRGITFNRNVRPGTECVNLRAREAVDVFKTRLSMLAAASPLGLFWRAEQQAFR